MPSHPSRRTVTIAAIAVSMAVAALLIWRISLGPRVRYITGAILTQHPDPHRQRPLENATITAEYAATTVKATSDSAGFFRLRLNPPAPAGDPIRLQFHHPNFHAYTTVEPASQEIKVIRLKPTVSAVELNAVQKLTRIANVRVRYATKATSTVNVASAVRTFDVVNQGNVPCQGRRPCSPDGKWKASMGSITINTGEDGKEFRNARASCIAGPCPFTSIEKDGFSRGGREITVAVRNWSDTVTYLVEAEVAQTIQSEMIRHTYPVIFGRSLNFTLPAPAQGPTIEAEVDGAEIVFPLGPKLVLSWANCQAETGAEGARLYRCELKTGFQFK